MLILNLFNVRFLFCFKQISVPGRFCEGADKQSRGGLAHLGQSRGQWEPVGKQGRGLWERQSAYCWVRRLVCSQWRGDKRLIFRRRPSLSNTTIRALSLP